MCGSVVSNNPCTGVDPELYEKTGLFCIRSTSTAKLAHAHYRQAYRVQSARSWPVPNPPQVIGIYVPSVLA